VIGVATVICAVLVSLLLTRVATVALTLTGLSRETAAFQARSALSGAGFTTSESEAIVRQPARRRIVMFLMLVGSVGAVTVIATLVLSFVGTDSSQQGTRLALLVGGLLVLLLLARSPTVDRVLTPLITRILHRWTNLDTNDYAELLHLGEYSVVEIALTSGHPAVGRSLGELDLRSRGIVAFGIARADGRYQGVPSFATQLEGGDTLLAYGSGDALADFCRADLNGRPSQGRSRASGDEAGNPAGAAR
jgi:hypothetical protein